MIMEFEDRDRTRHMVNVLETTFKESNNGLCLIFTSQKQWFETKYSYEEVRAKLSKAGLFSGDKND